MVLPSNSELDSAATALGLTNNYKNGVPRSFRFSRDGLRLFFLRSASGRDRRLDLWYRDCLSQREIKLWTAATSPRKAVSSCWAAANDSYRARMRESGSGVVEFDVDALGKRCAFSLYGRIHVLEVGKRKTPFPVDLQCEASSLRLSPDGSRLSYVSRDEVFVSKIVGRRVLKGVRVSPKSSADQFWGRPDFIGAEEMGRSEGQWWRPDSQALIFQGVDNREVTKWCLSDPSAPTEAGRTIAYPQAGTANASLELRLWKASGRQTSIMWDRERFPYLIGVSWRLNDPVIMVQTRDQRMVISFRVDDKTGKTYELHRASDKKWIELTPGVPSWTSSGLLVDASTLQQRRLFVDGRAISKPGLQLRGYVGQRDDGGHVYTASQNSVDTQVWCSTESGEHTLVSPAEGVYDAALGGNSIIVYGTSLDRKPHYNLLEITMPLQRFRFTLTNYAERIRFQPVPIFLSAEQRKVHYAICLPRKYKAGTSLPVLLDPYGGPHGQRCRRSALSFTTSQWFAEQGFAVIVADGRGTPGRDRKWEKAISGDLLRPTVDDQILALKDALRRYPFLDGSRVAIRGWSFGGYLAIGTALLYPEIVSKVIAGAPVTDWRLYDTHYTERYLGFPNRKTDNTYERSSLIRHIGKLRAKLLIVHGLVDDNVHISHSLALSRLLLSHGKAHTFLPLGGVSHSPPSEVTPLILRAERHFLMN